MSLNYAGYLLSPTECLGVEQVVLAMAAAGAITGGGGGGGGGGGSSYITNVGTEAELVTLTTARKGSRANVGASPATYLLYELLTDDYSNLANWQALQGTIVDGNVVTKTLLPGSLTRLLQLTIPSGSDAKLRVTIGGTLQPQILSASTEPHLIRIVDDVNVAAPGTVSFQRTGGTAATSVYSLS